MRREIRTRRKKAARLRHFGRRDVAFAAALLVTMGGSSSATAAENRGSAAPSASNETAGHPAVEPERLAVQVLATYPHDPQAYTQGLLLHDGTLYESTGLHGRSSLRQVEVASGVVLRRIDLPREVFAEGLARVGERLIQLTWKEKTAPVYDLATFEKLWAFSYETEGWGLCFDGESLVMSDGSHRLYFRDPETFALQRQLAVTERGNPVAHLNELECVGDVIYANVWPTSRIVKIYKRNGTVGAVIDAAPLLSAVERQKLGSEAILNGIAYDRQSDTFLLTGKLWPKLVRVRFVAAP